MDLNTKEAIPHSVEEIWQATIKRFQERTGQRLDAVSKSPDDLRRALDAHCASQTDAEDVAKVKDVGLKMINCFQLLGGIAAQGASMVFGPAGLCFNALSFLLDIPKKVHEFHGEINAIFAEVGPALVNFRIYQRMEQVSEVDEALRISIYNVMMSFIDLCAKCINIHFEGRWKSIRRHAKRLLLDDQSVKGELDNFKRLTQDQQNLQATLTLEVAIGTGQDVKFVASTVMATKTDVSGLVDAERKRGLDENRRKELDGIKKKLGVKSDTMSNINGSREKMWQNLMKGSVQWLNDVEGYSQWIDPAGVANDPLLLLTGAAGTGKSYLISAIAKNIESYSPTASAERNLLGYYSFSSIGGKSDSDKSSPETAIKYICAQLAEQDTVYAKHIAGVCGDSKKNEKYFKDLDCMTLWNELLVGAPAKNTRHYILLDSLNTLSPEECETLIAALKSKFEDEKSGRVRILLSGQDKAFEGGEIDVDSMPTIDIANENGPDISAFIEKSMEDASLLQDKDDNTEHIRNTVQEKLLDRSNGSYLNVRTDIGKIEEIINSNGSEEDLNKMLQESSRDLELMVRSDIATLEAVLKPNEIDEVNELLVWTVVGVGSFNLDELAAALFLRFQTVSLQPLKQKVVGKYSRIFSLTQDAYVEPKENVEKCVITERDSPRQSGDRKISATITITNADVEKVQRFLWDLNQHAHFGGFSFEHDGTGTVETGRKKIRLNEVDAHLDIVKRAFEFLNDNEKDDRGKSLGNYLMGFLVNHLQPLYEARGLDALPDAEKGYIGYHIYEMFNSGGLIEKNWDFCHWVGWPNSSSDMTVFWNWLDDPVATRRLGSRDKAWLADLKKQTDPNRELLIEVTTMVARRWLQDTEWEVTRLINWIRGVLSLVSGPRILYFCYRWVIDVSLSCEQSAAEESEEGESTNETGTPDNKDDTEADDENEDDGYIVIKPQDSIVEELVKAEKWCKELLKVTDPDSVWYLRLGLTYAEMWEHAHAVEQYKKAANILQAQDPVDKDKLREVYKSLGDWSIAAEAPWNVAAEYYKQAQEQDPANVEILHAMLKLYVSNRQTEEARNILQRVATEKSPDTESTLLVPMLKCAGTKGDVLGVYKTIISLGSSAPELWTKLQQETEAAIVAARAEDNNVDLATMLLHMGSATYYLSEESTDDITRAVGYWQECLSTLRDKVGSDDRDGVDYVEQSTLGYMSKVYLERAIPEQTGQPGEAAATLMELLNSSKTYSNIKYTLASYHTLRGNRGEARNQLRDEMVDAFNILMDDDIANDWEGYQTLRHILNHSGDYEGAMRADQMLSAWSFDETVLKALVASEDGSLNEAATGLVEFYQSECLTEQDQRGNFQKILSEAEQRSADEDEDKASAYKAIHELLTPIGDMRDNYTYCDGCLQDQNYTTSFYGCKVCHNVDLCAECWEKLRGGDRGIVPQCSAWHEWWEAPACTTEQFIRACRGMIQAKDSEMMTVSKWLGGLCDEWGLSKTQWNFE
ncbi:hypothetical protein FE257_008180 [Aspergillus nanangensis]|uniref:Fungal STAND N-terminal Goodbye domain-containing protein n=1 Tax=Aspergillus nanangensis TaxID=2582783 RepID=A0AAD4CLV0_ASPNN|nr:hypothetical protein FE257_008180 [Aspergillus nanangensis]